jgi:DNA-binding LacI/PurR family transcriptional regulator
MAKRASKRSGTKKDATLDQPRKYPSSIEVARLAGVSQSAVSRTYTAGASVSDATRAKVTRAAARIGYRPSAIPRIMQTSQSNLVGIAAGGLYNPLNTALLEAYTIRLQNAGYQVLLFHVTDTNSLDELVPRLAAYRIDGLFLTRTVLSRRSSEEFQKFHIPVISFDTLDKNDWVSSVCPDDQGGGRLVANLFVQRGATKAAYLAGKSDNVASNERLEGFRAALEQLGAKITNVSYCAFQYEAGYRAALEVLSPRSRPEAIFCANDLIALGAVDAARRLGISIPNDLMIAGFDNIPQSSWRAYDLTTVNPSPDSIVETSLMIFKKVLDRAIPGGVRILVPVTLIERASTSSALAINN